MLHMDPSVFLYALGCALLAGLATNLLVAPVMRLAVAFQALDHPGGRRLQSGSVPRLGGVAIATGIALAIGAAAAARWRDWSVGLSRNEIMALAFGTLLVFLVGLVDDLVGVGPGTKFAFQILAAGLLLSVGWSFEVLRLPFVGEVHLGWLGGLVSLLWIVGVTNAINLIDGLDGLAAGVVGIAGAAFFLYSLRLNDSGLLADSNLAPLVAIIAVGVCLGFLPHNAHPARIFMGDAGALFLGLLLAASTILVGGRTADQFSGQTFFFFAPLVIPFVILGVPMLDIALAIVRRAARRTSIAMPDKEHLHHRLMRLGHGQRRAVFILWAWTAVLAGFVLAPTYTNEGNALVPFGIAALALILYAIFHPTAREARRAAVEADVTIEERVEELEEERLEEVELDTDDVVVLLEPPEKNGDGEAEEKPRPPRRRATSWPA